MIPTRNGGGFLDPHISPELVPRLALVFTALEMNPWYWVFDGIAYETRDPEELRRVYFLWDSVWQAMPRVSGGGLQI